MAIGLNTIADSADLLTARHAGGSIIIGGIDILASLESQSVLSFAVREAASHASRRIQAVDGVERRSRR
jgi:hypothetical protein